jgi:hemin uptake protein HemP
MMTTNLARSIPAARHGPPAAEPLHRIPSGELLRGRRRVVIDHGDVAYTLMLTRNGKLILVK